MASIIDKAREYSLDNNESKDAFLNGALWMLEKACEYMRSQYPVHYQEWYELAEEHVKQFKKGNGGIIISKNIILCGLI